MTIQPSTTTEKLRVERMTRWYTGRSELFVAAGVLALAGVLAYGTATMEIPGEVDWPGPQFFPTIVTVFLAVVGVALAVDVLRPKRRSHVADDPTEISDEMLQDLGGIDSTSELRVVSPEEMADAGIEPQHPADATEAVHEASEAGSASTGAPSAGSSSRWRSSSCSCHCSAGSSPPPRSSGRSPAPSAASARSSTSASRP